MMPDDDLMAEILVVLGSVPDMLQAAVHSGYANGSEPAATAEYQRLQPLEDRWWALVVRLGVARSGDWPFRRLTVPSEGEGTDGA